MMKSYVEQLEEWTERVLLKGVAHMDMRDSTELEQLCEQAKGLQLDFLAELCSTLTAYIRHYVRDPQADANPLIQHYFYVCQYIKILRKNHLAH